MKTLFASIPILSFLILFLSGCNAVGDKNASLSIIYGVAAILSLLLLIGCCLVVRKKKIWFILLFSSVLIVNIGYTFLAISTSLKMALWANLVAYLGSVFLPLAMLMIVLEVTSTPHPKWLHGALGTLSIIVFLIAASPGILPIYYKEVRLEVMDGVSTLVKVYGPLHPIYLIYLLGYFAAIVMVIIRSHVKKAIDNAAHAVILAIAVFVNIGVWFIEQLVAVDFEMLSISYIISELFLLGIHLAMNENQRLRAIVKQVETVQRYSTKDAAAPDIMLERPVENEVITPERIEFFMIGLKTLTPTEKVIYDAYIARVTTKEIMASMDIKESTLKYHNRNLYGKLGVASRKELLEVHKHLKSVNTLLKEVNAGGK
ncbi:MAG: histidine kinase N-terminal 7TM domain-containing protein [Oscillospiraceae bacterium]|nr:histidine kinase N-terminal 7TM domain-containing protein [Oscillospiraceae bacterium]